jgi:YidC/Oxa1 family membrane protein insertase
MNFIWHTFFFDPVYNSLVFFIDVVRGGDVGLAIICTVVLVKIVLLPLSLKAARTQLVMRELEPKLAKIKEDYKDKRDIQAIKTMELFKEARINPLSSIGLLFLQLPIIFALYFAVYSGGGVALPGINVALLYSYIPTPDTVNTVFLGVTEILKPAVTQIPVFIFEDVSIPVKVAGLFFALLAGITQFIHTRLSLPPLKPQVAGAAPNFKDDFARSMQLQMRYVMPVIIVVVAYSLSTAIALYFTISNIMSIAQEYIVRHQGLKVT